MKNDKIDVCINVFGKPYETITTINSLLEHSGSHIDKIYYIEEANQLPDYNFDLIQSHVDYELIRFIPKYYEFYILANEQLARDDEDYRMSIRYQYGFSTTDKKFLFITHNDVLYTGDIIGEMIKSIGDNVAIGELGQCWNCPMKSENLCDGNRLNDNYDKQPLSYDKAMEITNRYANEGYQRVSVWKHLVHKTKPFPMPECRVNEWSALVNVEIHNKETFPKGDIIPFGAYLDIDTSTKFFRDMMHKGYKFANFPVKEYSVHGYFIGENGGPGHPSMFNKDRYEKTENLAKEYLQKNYIK